MKANYENRSKTYLTRRVPVIVRLDGKAFHTFTKKFKKPYDKVFHKAMDATMKYLCENIQGCKLGYTQSDEITLLLTDYDTLTTDAWFGYNVQKMCSVAASMATMAFNKFFAEGVHDFNYDIIRDPVTEELDAEQYNQFVEYMRAVDRGAMFDARCFNVPKEEVTNCFIWRQQDATRNAIQMLGQVCFSHNELDKKSQSDIQDMLMLQKGINFNDMPVKFKRGVCCVKSGTAERSHWTLDYDIPIFTQDRDYVERYV